MGSQKLEIKPERRVKVIIPRKNMPVNSQKQNYLVVLKKNVRKKCLQGKTRTKHK